MKKLSHVAVAIIHYGEKYLLGYRNANQHQGEKYEFIGGKIEQHELPKQALLRETFEEIGCDISDNTAIKMGVIRHDYSDKSIALHCFKIELIQSQYEQLQGEIGQEGQTIIWIEKVDLLAEKYPLPDANARILDWLKLPEVIFISHSLQDFESENAWLNYYLNQLPQNAHFYFRLKSNVFNSTEVATDFQLMRKDVFPILSYSNFAITQDFLKNTSIFKNFWIHLNHKQLIEITFKALPNTLCYFVSCHDEQSIRKVNQLAETHNVMGCFLSPVLPTLTHPETIANGGMGWENFSELAEICDVPVYGLGGLGRGDLEKVWVNNGFGVAGIRLIEDFEWNLRKIGK